MDGLEDIRRGIDLALEQGSVLMAAQGFEDLSAALSVSAGPSHALPEVDAGAALARRSGVLDAAESIDIAVRSDVLYALGRWDEVMDAATAYLAGDREDRQAGIRLMCQLMVCDISTWRGDLARASELSHDVHLGVRAFGGVQAQQVIPWLSVVANLALAAGDVDRAVSVLHEIEAYPNIREALSYAEALPQIIRVALGAVGIRVRAATRYRRPRIIDGAAPHLPRDGRRTARGRPRRVRPGRGIVCVGGRGLENVLGSRASPVAPRSRSMPPGDGRPAGRGRAAGCQ